MTRNLNRRVEVACPIYNPQIKKKLNTIIEYNLRDNKKARILNLKGNYVKLEPSSKEFIAQDAFIKQAKKLEPLEDKKKKTFMEKLKDFFRKLNKELK